MNLYIRVASQDRKCWLLSGGCKYYCFCSWCFESSGTLHTASTRCWSVVAVFELGRLSKASWSTFWRCWTSTWFHCLRLRKPCQHSQCDVCWEASQYLHHGMGSWREKQVRAQQWQLHLRQQYADRCVYWHSGGPASSRDQIFSAWSWMDLISQSWFFHSTTFVAPSSWINFSDHAVRFTSPLCMAMPPISSFLKKRAFFMGAAMCWRFWCGHWRKWRRKGSGKTFNARHLCLQSDNTVSQLKNAESSLFLGVLLRRFGFDTCGLTYLQKGHTHEDVDFVFSLLLGRVLRKVKIQCPQDLCEGIKAGMEDLLLAKGYKTHAELVTHCRNFKSWLDNLGVTPHGCYLPRQGRDCPHSFCFKFRMDLSQLEKRSSWEDWATKASPSTTWFGRVLHHKKIHVKYRELYSSALDPKHHHCSLASSSNTDHWCWDGRQAGRPTCMALQQNLKDCHLSGE